MNILQRMESKRLQHPDKIAIIQGEQTLTYHALGKQVDTFALSLRDYDVQPDCPVVIFMRRSFDMLSAIVAIWKCHAAYLPIDPQTPFKRIQHILDEAQPKCIRCV